MQHLKEIGKVVYLKLSYETISARLSNIKGRGVVLKDGQTLKDLYDERRVLYEKYADIILDLDGQDIEETVEELAKALDISKKRM